MTDIVERLKSAIANLEETTLEQAALEEIEQLRAENQRLRYRCAALAYLHYGHDPVRRTRDSVQADIEACESALTALRAELRALPQSEKQ